MEKLFSFRKYNRLKRKVDFENVFRNGKVYKTKTYKFYYIPSTLSQNRLAIMISRKICKSVLRNREKRIIREFFRKAKVEFANNYDIVVQVIKLNENKVEKINELNNFFNILVR